MGELVVVVISEEDAEGKNGIWDEEGRRVIS